MSPQTQDSELSPGNTDPQQGMTPAATQQPGATATADSTRQTSSPGPKPDALITKGT